MPVQLPTEGAVAHPAALHGRDDAAHPEGEARLGIGSAERAQPVGPVQELLGRPGLCRRQAMLGTEVSFGVVLSALRHLPGCWLASGGWMLGPFHGPFRLRVLVQAVEWRMVLHGCLSVASKVMVVQCGGGRPHIGLRYLSAPAVRCGH